MNEKKYSIKDLEDLVAAIHNRGFESGQNYGEPSTGTIKLINDINRKLDIIHDAIFGNEAEEGLLSRAKKTNGNILNLKMWKYGLTTAWGVGFGLIVFFTVYIGLPAFKELSASVADLHTTVISHIAKDDDNFSKLK